MADLGGRTTSGELAWDKYVHKNKKWKELKLEVERDGELLKKTGSKLERIISVSKGTTIQLKSNLASNLMGKKYATVVINRKEGLILISSIRKPTNFAPTGYETEVVNLINKHIAQNNNIPIDIMIKGTNKTYKGISGAIQVDTQIKRQGGVSADPKADIILYVDKKNILSPNNIFISHKKEGGPEAFQQYGGLTEKAGEEIYNHPETKKFLKAVAKNIDPEKGLRNPMFMKVKDNKLKNMSIYGPEFTGKYGLQHVQLIGQGLPKLTPTKKENVYVLDFTSHMSISGNLSHFGGGYTPVFGATFRAGRGFELDGKRYDGARVGIYPIKLIETRGGVTEVK
jgi:hypothetical protein